MSDLFERQVCIHEWMDAYRGGGLSKHSPHITILVFYCKKCLAIRTKKLEEPDVMIMPETLELYEDGNEDSLV